MTFKVLYTSDLHGHKEFYKRFIEKAKEEDVKAVIIGGDLCPRTEGSVDDWVKHQKDFLENFFIPQMKDLCKVVFVIMGNDDFRINEHVLMQEKNANIRYIHKRRYPIFSKAIVGYSFVNTTPFRLKDWEKSDNGMLPMPQQMFKEEIRTVMKEEGTIEEDLEQFIKLSNPKNTVYVMHAPPYKTKLDIINDGTHVGSKAIRNFIEKEQPYLTLHGHIHESQKMSGSFVDKIGETVCINVGSSYPEDKLNCAVIDLKNLDIKYLEL